MLFIDGYRIDVEVRADVQRSNVVTRFPVEKGADVTDHVQPEPITLDIEGIVSDTPLTEMAVVRSQFAIINGEAFSKPSEEARARLDKLNTDREPITVECSAGVFRNMVLEKLNETRDASTGDSYQFTATFSEMVFVTNERTTIQTATPRGKKKVNLGHQPSVTLGGRVVELASASAGLPLPPGTGDTAIEQLYPSTALAGR